MHFLLLSPQQDQNHNFSLGSSWITSLKPLIPTPKVLNRPCIATVQESNTERSREVLTHTVHMIYLSQAAQMQREGSAQACVPGVTILRAN